MWGPKINVLKSGSRLEKFGNHCRRVFPVCIFLPHKESCLRLIENIHKANYVSVHIKVVNTANTMSALTR